MLKLTINNLLITFLISFVFVSVSYATSVLSSKESGVIQIPKASYEIQTARDFAYSNYPDSARFDLGEFSTQEENQIKDMLKRTKPSYIGIGREMALARNNWVRVKQGGGFDVWQVHIHSPDAANLKVHFTDFNLSNGMSVNVYSYDKSDTYTKEYTGQGWTGNGRFWSQMVKGHTIVVEFWSPTSKGLSFSNFPFSIDRISHIFRDKDGVVHGVSSQIATPQSHGACPVRNNVCRYTNETAVTVTLSDGTKETRSLRDGVAKYSVTKSDGSAPGLCTGALIANGNKDNSTLYFLTAWHCVEDVVVSPSARKGTLIAASFEFLATDCDATSVRGTNARFIAGHAIGDYALLRIEGPLLRSGGSKSIISLGWMASTPLDTNDEFMILHHGVINRVQTNQNYATATVRNLRHLVGLNVLCSDGVRRDCDDLRPCQGSGCSHYGAHHVVGGTIGGSSGAPALYDRINPIVGVFTHNDLEGTCNPVVSRFFKIYEDGRVKGALEHGDDYYNGTANFDDRARPSYRYTPASSGGSGGGGGGGGGATDPWFLLLLLPLLLLFIRSRVF